jgi:hypothetical protein
MSNFTGTKISKEHVAEPPNRTRILQQRAVPNLVCSVHHNRVLWIPAGESRRPARRSHKRTRRPGVPISAASSATSRLWARECSRCGGKLWGVAWYECNRPFHGNEFLCSHCPLQWVTARGPARGLTPCGGGSGRLQRISFPSTVARWRPGWRVPWPWSFFLGCFCPQQEVVTGNRRTAWGGFWMKTKKLLIWDRAGWWRLNRRRRLSYGEGETDPREIRWHSTLTYGSSGEKTTWTTTGLVWTQWRAPT